MAKFNWQEFLRAPEGNNTGSRSSSKGLRQLERQAQRTQLLRSMRWALLILGFALGYIALHFSDSWVTVSPLFATLGAGASLVFLIASWIAGALFWLVTKNAALCIWALELMPFAAQPYRSAAGVLAFFLILARYLERLPGVRRIGLPPLEVFHWLLWACAGGACLIAIPI